MCARPAMTRDLPARRRLGDKAAWAKIVAQGDKLAFEHAIGGFKAMPARGGNSRSDRRRGQARRRVHGQPGGRQLDRSGRARPAAATTAAAPAPATAPAAAAPAPGSASRSCRTGRRGAGDGKKVYDSGCIACHGAGIAGAPKFGDKAAWAPRIKTGDGCAVHGRAPRQGRHAAQGRQYHAVGCRRQGRRQFHGVGGEVTCAKCGFTATPHLRRESQREKLWAAMRFSRKNGNEARRSQVASLPTRCTRMRIDCPSERLRQRRLSTARALLSGRVATAIDALRDFHTLGDGPPQPCANYRINRASPCAQQFDHVVTCLERLKALAPAAFAVPLHRRAAAYRRNAGPPARARR